MRIFALFLNEQIAATIDAPTIEKSRPRLRQGSEMATKSTPKWYLEPPFSHPEQISKIDTPLQRNYWFLRSGRSRKHPEIKKRTLRKRGATKHHYVYQQIKKQFDLASLLGPFWGLEWTLFLKHSIKLGPLVADMVPGTPRAPKKYNLLLRTWSQAPPGHPKSTIWELVGHLFGWCRAQILKNELPCITLEGNAMSYCVPLTRCPHTIAVPSSRGGRSEAQHNSYV